MSQSQLAGEIIAAFKKLECENAKKANDWSTKRWTKEVLTTLCRLGKNFGFSAWANNVPEKDKNGGKGEWLYDVTWCESDDDRLLKSIPMVAECEWANLAEIDDGFQKLLVARAKVRVMVYDARHADGGTKAIANRLCEWVGAFESTRGTLTC